jgi:chloramphenicol-sensitive protein RarD
MSPSEPATAGGTHLRSAREEALRGVLYAAAGYFLWGISVAFYKLFGGIGLDEMMAHRIVWSVVLMAAILVVSGRFAGLRWALRSRRTVATLLVTSSLIAINWTVFLWAVANGRVLEVSLGYYVNPLVSVLLGYVLLGERLTRAQTVAVGLAAVAVLIQGIGVGAWPWISLTLAVSFGFYGYFRKTVAIGAAEGLFVEVSIFAPFCLAYVIWLGASGTGAFLTGWWPAVLLVATGPWTAMPLLCFAAGARRLRLATLGQLQYLGPSIQFLLAIFAFGEPLRMAGLVSFVLLWLGLAVYTADLIRQDRRWRSSGARP